MAKVVLKMADGTEKVLGSGRGRPTVREGVITEQREGYEAVKGADGYFAPVREKPAKASK